jgi:hypothetical protein
VSIICVSVSLSLQFSELGPSQLQLDQWLAVHSPRNMHGDGFSVRSPCHPFHWILIYYRPQHSLLRGCSHLARVLSTPCPHFGNTQQQIQNDGLVVSGDINEPSALHANSLLDADQWHHLCHGLFGFGSYCPHMGW